MRPDVYIHVCLGWTDEGCRSAFKGLLGGRLERMHAIKSTKMWHSWGFKNWRLHVSAGPSVEAVIYKTSSCVDDDIDM